MIWIASWRNNIFLAKDSTYFLAIALDSLDLLSQTHKITLDRCKNLLNNSMCEFREFLSSHGELPLQSRDTVGRARSEENIFTSSSAHPCLIHPLFIGNETIAFSSPLGPNSPHLMNIPMPPMPGSRGLISHSSQNLLAPHNGENTKTRYYLRRTKSTSNSSEKNSNEVSEILKVFSKRCWQDVTDIKKSSKKYFEFTLMSYNVLAQNLINDHPYLYKSHNPKALNWETRWKNVLNEIKTMRPDILCLQEVQESHLNGYYSQLESLGYQGLYKKRTGIRCDGCAIYYKPDRLNLVEFETVEFYQPMVTVLNRDNIAIIAKLCPRHSPEHQFIVATTHLLYNPRRQDVRLAQTQLLLTEVERMSFYRNSKGKEKYWPIIITGDFNSTPDSVIYKFITNGLLKYDNLAARRMDRVESPKQGNILVPSHLQITDCCQHASLVQKRQKSEDMSRTEEAALIKLHNSDKCIIKISSEIIKNPGLFSSGILSHLFALKSVYQHGEPSNPEGSTYQDKWITVDYIFYSGKKQGCQTKDHKLKLWSTYRLPLRNDLGSIKIPNSLIGSDHLSLVAKFSLKI